MQKHYTPLIQPTKISDQTWPAGTTPLVSIVCITYNHSKYIKDAIDGFLLQCTTFPVEILIHDDASNDGTSKIISEYASKYPQLIKCLFQNENIYKKPNRNELIKPFLERIEGEYVALCEGDDFWISPEKLQKQVDFLEANRSYVFCFHPVRLVYENGVERQDIFSDLSEREYTRCEILKKWNVPTCSVLYRKNCHDHYVYDKDYLFLDITLFLTLATKGKVYCLDGLQAAYRRHPAGVSTGAVLDPDYRRKIINHYKAIGRNINIDCRRALRHILSEAYLNLASALIKKSIVLFFFHLTISFAYSPRVFFKNVVLRASKRIDRYVND